MAAEKTIKELAAIADEIWENIEEPGIDTPSPIAIASKHNLTANEADIVFDLVRDVEREWAQENASYWLEVSDGLNGWNQSFGDLSEAAKVAVGDWVHLTHEEQAKYTRATDGACYRIYWGTPGVELDEIYDFAAAGEADADTIREQIGAMQ